MLYSDSPYKMKRIDIAWARFAFIIALSLLSIVVGIWIPVYSYMQWTIMLFILIAARGGMMECHSED